LGANNTWTTSGRGSWCKGIVVDNAILTSDGALVRLVAEFGFNGTEKSVARHAFVSALSMRIWKMRRKVGLWVYKCEWHIGYVCVLECV